MRNRSAKRKARSAEQNNHANAMRHAPCSMRLNLACGNDYRAECVNLDLTPPCDVVADVTQGLPFKGGAFGYVLAGHILEHIRDLRALKRELARVLKPGARLHVFVPHYLSPDAWGDDTHCRAFSSHSFWPQYWPGYDTALIERRPTKGKNSLCPEEANGMWIYAVMVRNQEPYEAVKGQYGLFVKKGLKQ